MTLDLNHKVSVYVLATATILFIALAIMSTIKKENKQIANLCIPSFFEDNITLHGDFAGKLDCNKYWDDTFSNGRWSSKCSGSIFSFKVSCHSLCNVDCYKKNKIGGTICIC